MAEPLVVIEDVGVKIGNRWLLRHVSLRVHPGEILSVIGPNGAGKTTLVKAVLGLVPVAEGRIRRPPSEHIGYVPQRLSLDPVLPLSVFRLATLPRTVPRARVVAALTETGVAGLIDAPVAGLSGGEFQRVLLARALLRDPALLVLDEPVQGVDYAGEAALYDLIARVRAERGCAVLMISHDLHVVMAATDTVACLNGTVCCSGPPHAVADLPAFQALFGPRAGSLALYAHHHHPLSGQDPS
ncbi:metal ABC transporter ATP-binding protein [Pararhodospirillum photometricum]|uniref:High-affinity zinc uptake system ATP-binding protein ZnuC n=1 Tax=Pararhodospirillum photometricum DSM 122 TaxID=1150469 RepID=H6SSD5_PARPM|nr:metal ABC transporter ATP-binding protein [Pararhodospirillum photometricum]CCG07814.1 High-affinity zinc uptake system ATP-binding protein ZnuC [Pararhodospirillum photometricum DSM 122]